MWPSYGASMQAILVKLSSTLILDDKSALRCAIWLCIYCRNVSDVQRPCFIIVVSLSPLSFKAIAPPARNECTPTRFGVMPEV